MNPGLLDTRIEHQRRNATRGADGSVSTEWATIGSQWARRMRPKGGVSAKDDKPGDPKDEERRTIVFRVRCQPFLTNYGNGDRFAETGNNNMPAALWRVLAWSEADGNRGAYIDVSCESWED